MLSKSQVVKTRKAIESLYDGSCNVVEYQEYIKSNKTKGFKEVTVIENQPCRLSFSSSPVVSANENLASNLNQNVKLFISPDLTIKAGTKISVTQNGVTTDFKRSGEVALYDTHQEINLELFKGWS